MRILALDLSTKPGFAVLDFLDGEPKIVHSSSKKYKMPKEELEDLAFVHCARTIAGDCRRLVQTYNPDIVVIEQTNQGRSRTTQKILEFIHFAVLSKLFLEDDGIRPTVIYMDSSIWRSKIRLKLTKEQRSHNKLVKNHLAKKKVTWKHLSVEWVNQKFNLTLKLKDNDIADAVCMACAAHASLSNRPGKPDIDKLFKS